MSLGIKGSSALGTDAALFRNRLYASKGMLYTLGVEGKSQSLCSPILCLGEFPDVGEAEKKNSKKGSGSPL